MLERPHSLLSDFPRGDPDREPHQHAAPAAHFASPEDILEEPAARWEPGRLFLGLIDGQPTGPPARRHVLGGTPIGVADDRHVCTFAGSRAGKGRSAIVPNMLHWPGSVLATDPKGELATMTARRRAALGQNVHVLDPFGVTAGAAISFRCGFNPIEAMRPGREIEDAALIGDALVMVEGDPHWDESARGFIEGVALHVRTWPRYDGRRDLFTVQDAVGQGAADANAASGVSMTALRDDMQQNGAAEGVIRAAGESLFSKPDKERDSVLSSARRHLKFLDLFRQSAAGRVTLEDDGFRLDDLKTERTTIYLCLPARHIGTCSRWLRLFVNLTLQAMERTPAKSLPGGVPVLFCLDEFAALGRLEQVESAAGQMAGFGVKLWPVLQDLGQLKALYRDRWETFLGNAGILQFFGNNDLTTLEWIVKRCGKTAIRERSDKPVTADQAGQGLPGESWSTQVYDLLGVDEAARLFGRDDPQLRQLVLWGGLPPLVLQRAHYDTHALFRDKGRPLFDPPPSLSEGPP